MGRALTLGFSTVIVILSLVVATAPLASASSVLLYDDYLPNGSPSTWESALNGLPGFNITTVSTDAQFLSLLNTMSWDLVVVQFDGFDPVTPDPNFPQHSVDPALTTYISNGGRVIYNSSISQYDATFQVSDPKTFAQRQADQVGMLAFLSLSPVLADGLSDSQTINPFGYTVAWRSFDTSADVLGTFDDGRAGIVRGNDRHTIINGFLGDAFDSPDQEIRLYQNEVRLLLAVPEPATGALLGLGLLVTAAVGYRRRK